MTTSNEIKINVAYKVEYCITAENFDPTRLMTSRVAIMDGDTTFADIPKILAISKGVDIAHVFVISAVFDGMV